MIVRDLILALAEHDGQAEVYLHAPIGPAPVVRVAQDTARNDETPGVTKIKRVVVLSSR